MRPSTWLPTTAIALVAGLVFVSLAEARGGGRTGPGGVPTRGTGGVARARMTGLSRAGGKSDNSEEAMKELEDRVALIADRRKRLADTEREAGQEVRLAAGRLDTAETRTGEDVR